MHDPFGAFVDRPRAVLDGSGQGPLSGLSFAVKDLFDIQGISTTAGNPTWAATHPTPHQTAPAVLSLVDAGAKLVGKTITDELAYSLMGRNIHDGTPINPAAPDRLPGGSSSGSAAAVAGGLVDFALGTDTGGSVRLPASFCGVYGFRPSHGRIDMSGIVPLAPSFDVVGWFAGDPSILRSVGSVLGLAGKVGSRRLLVAEDALLRADRWLRPAFDTILSKLTRVFGAAESVTLAPDGLTAWSETFRICQAAEAWASHGAWISANKPAFGPGIAQRFATAERLEAAEIEAAWTRRAAIRHHLGELLSDAIVCMPTVPGAAPLRVSSDEEQQAQRVRALEMLCPAGLGGLPQLSLPLLRLDDAPVGFSLMAAAGDDETLLGILDVVMATA